MSAQLHHRRLQRRALVARLTGDLDELGTVAYTQALAERKAAAETARSEQQDHADHLTLADRRKLRTKQKQIARQLAQLGIETE